jgi:hypothetical protein
MKGVFYTRQQIDSAQWDNFIKASPQNNIYALSGYLDCVCPQWGAVIVKNDEQWLAVMPLNVNKKYFLQYSLKPRFVQYLGVILGPLQGKIHRLIYLKRTITEQVIAAIPPGIKLFNHNFSPGFDYFIPFHWHRFEIRPFHTYHLSLRDSLENIWSNFSASVCNGIKKAEKQNLNCVTSNSAGELLKMMQNRHIISASAACHFEKLWNFIYTNHSAFTLYIIHPHTGQIYCGAAFVVYHHKITMLASAMDLRFKKSRAKTLLVWYAIQKAHAMDGITVFDFEGSMIKGIENYNRGFGASPLTYYNISKNNLPIPHALGFSIKNRIAAGRNVLAK